MTERQSVNSSQTIYSTSREEGDKEDIWHHVVSFLAHILNGFSKPTVPSNSANPSVQKSAYTLRSPKLFIILATRGNAAYTKKPKVSKFSTWHKSIVWKTRELSGDRSLELSVFSVKYTNRSCCLKNVKRQQLIATLVSCQPTCGSSTDSLLQNLQLISNNPNN
jgi:hypothetical protein